MWLVPILAHTGLPRSQAFQESLGHDHLHQPGFGDRIRVQPSNGIVLQAMADGCIVKKCKSIGVVYIEEMISEITPYLQSVGCWVNTVMDGGVDCIEEIDDRDLEKFEYMICSRQGFFSGRPSCLKIAEEVFG
ncbi:UNVERIFIED_CONTAM: hypothetical protein FKN15_034189 [Acipenser sinensis]